MRPLDPRTTGALRVVGILAAPLALGVGLLGPCLVGPVLLGVSDHARLAADVRTAALEEGCLVNDWEPLERDAGVIQVIVDLQCPTGRRSAEWVLGWRKGRWTR